MTLDPDRVREMFWLFSKVLPMSEEDKPTNKAIFGATASELLPEIAQTVGLQASKNLELLDEYFDFIVDAVKYMRSETDNQPNVSYNQTEIQKDYLESRLDFDKNAKPA